MSHLIPQPLKSKPAPFDHPDWIFELKYDGFRAVAHVENGRCGLISRNGAPFASFSNLAADIGRSFGSRKAVLDGEIVCLDSKGHPQSSELRMSYHESTPISAAGGALSDSVQVKNPPTPLFTPGPCAFNGVTQ